MVQKAHRYLSPLHDADRLRVPAAMRVLARARFGALRLGHPLPALGENQARLEARMARNDLMVLPASQNDGTEAEATDALGDARSEEHTSELQSRENLVCRLLLEKKNRARSGR